MKHGKRFVKEFTFRMPLLKQNFKNEYTNTY